MVKVKPFAPQALTANRLKDGAVVYLRADGGWSEKIALAAAAADPADLERLLERAAEAVSAQFVVAPYAIEVTAESGAVKPVGLREHIRAFGPTVASPPAAAKRVG